MFKVIFVCSGNICRSPTAEAVFNTIVRREGLDASFRAASGGTHGQHEGDSADPRAQKAGKKRGYDLSGITARPIKPEMLKDYKLIVCMDNSHYDRVMDMCDHDDEHKVKMMLDFADGIDALEVPDPYYGTEKDFEHVLDLLENACAGLLNSIRHQVPSS